MTETLAPLTRDVGCRKDMMWATRLASAIPADGFLAALEAHGFSEGVGAIAGRLSVYDQADSGHRIIFVSRTGRIQIRLDALTRHEDRVAAAKRVYEVLRDLTIELLGTASPDNHLSSQSSNESSPSEARP